MRARLKVGAPVSLSGRYAVQGREARTGLEAWAHGHGVELVLRDDRSSPDDATRVYRQLVNTCRFVVGPYGSDSTRAVAEQAPGQVVWNHGAAADDVQRLPGVVSVPSPASGYLVALGRTVSQLRPNAAVCLLTAPGRFAAWARNGLIAAAPTLGLHLVDDPAAADVLLLCGPIAWEIRQIKRLHRPGLLIGGVSPGIANFPTPRRRPRRTTCTRPMAPRSTHPTTARPNIGPTPRLPGGTGLRRRTDRGPLPPSRPRRSPHGRKAASDRHLLRRLPARQRRPANRPPTRRHPLEEPAPRTPTNTRRLASARHRGVEARLHRASNAVAARSNGAATPFAAVSSPTG